MARLKFTGGGYLLVGCVVTYFSIRLTKRDVSQIATSFPSPPFHAHPTPRVFVKSSMQCQSNLASQIPILVLSNILKSNQLLHSRHFINHHLPRPASIPTFLRPTSNNQLLYSSLPSHHGVANNPRSYGSNH